MSVQVLFPCKLIEVATSMVFWGTSTSCLGPGSAILNMYLQFCTTGLGTLRKTQEDFALVGSGSFPITCSFMYNEVANVKGDLG